MNIIHFALKVYITDKKKKREGNLCLVWTGDYYRSISKRSHRVCLELPEEERSTYYDEAGIVTPGLAKLAQAGKELLDKIQTGTATPNGKYTALQLRVLMFFPIRTAPRDAKRIKGAASGSL